MALDANRRAGLERSRAEALLGACFDLDPASLDLSGAPFGVTAISGDHGWVVSMSEELAALGGALVWIDRHRLVEVDMVFDHHSEIHARRAARLAPQCRVWRVAGDDIAPATPAPIAAARARPDDAAHLETILVELGIDVVCEDGILRGEVAGLEVARIVHGPDGPVLEAGVGRFDREAAALLHGDHPPSEAVAAAAAQVRPHRTVGAPSHAVNRLARSRWLRALAVSEPSALDVSRPALVEPIPPRESLLEDGPAAFLAVDGDRRILVVCSVGVDLGLVPAIADLVAVHRPDSVRVVLPQRDRLPHLDRLLARVALPTDIQTVATPWVD